MGNGAQREQTTLVRLHPAAYHGAQVSVYGVETAAQPDTASAAGGDFAALLSTQSTEGDPLHMPPARWPYQRNAVQSGARRPPAAGRMNTAWQA